MEPIKPTILMGYFNQILQHGENKFLNKCQKIGVDGIIVVDLPFPENKEFADKCKKHHINFVQLLAPTTSTERMMQIIKHSHDMIYYISMLSTTGGKLKVKPKQILKNYFKIKKINKDKNIIIGFGITKKTIQSLKQADGLVVGSQLCKGISDSLKAKRNPVKALVNLVKSLKSKI
jgi:tryptophan synthase alpha chain